MTAIASSAAMPFLTSETQAGTSQKTNEQAVGLQLYTVRSLMAESVPKTLDLVASYGYREVECAGYADLDASDFRSAIDASGLQAPSGHVSLDNMLNNFDSTLEIASTVGHRHLILGWLAPEFRTVETYKRLADTLNKNGEKAKAANISVGYHNHEFEFETLDGVVPYEILLTETDPELVKFELDIYWCALAGVDPLTIMKRYPGRVPAVHVKDMGPNQEMVDVGTGTLDFARIYAARHDAGIKHFFVEHDNSADIPQTLSQSFQHFHDIITNER